MGNSDPLLVQIGTRLVDQDRDPRLPWHDDPVGFARECISWPEGLELAPYQADVLAGVAQHRRMAVRSLHGVGKTTTAALLVLWFAVTRDAAGTDWKAITTAGAWRQLERYLWPEIRLWARRLRFDKIGRPPFDERSELLQLSLNLRHGSAFAVASTDAALIEGAHAESIFYLFDESKAIAADIFDAAEGAFSTPGEVFALAQSTPGSPSGRFYEIHNRKPGLEDWRTRHVTLSEAIAAGRVSKKWADQRARQWGERSALYLNRVLGEFASDDEAGVIPLSWVELANERWRAWKDSGEDPGPVTVLGVDVARSGSDQTVLALRAGEVITELRRFTHADTMATTGRVAAVLQANPSCKAIVDVIGVGAGVVDRLREQGFRRTVAFNASAGTGRKDRSGELGFVNTRSAAWWTLRELLDPAYGPTLALPPDDLLTGDLVAPRYSVTSAGRLQVEGKDDVKKRIGRSTDSGDAVVQAAFEARMTQGQAFLELWRRQIAERQSAQEGRDGLTPSQIALQQDNERRRRMAARQERLAPMRKRLQLASCDHRWRKLNDQSHCVWCGADRAEFEAHA